MYARGILYRAFGAGGASTATPSAHRPASARDPAPARRRRPRGHAGRRGQGRARAARAAGRPRGGPMAVADGETRVAMRSRDGPGGRVRHGAGVVRTTATAQSFRPIIMYHRCLHVPRIHATPHRDLAARAFRLGAKHRVYTRRGTSDNSGGAMTKPTRRHHFTLLGRCSRPWTSPPSFSTTQ
jgi:hypothetical protein